MVRDGGAQLATQRLPWQVYVPHLLCVPPVCHLLFAALQATWHASCWALAGWRRCAAAPSLAPSARRQVGRQHLVDIESSLSCCRALQPSLWRILAARLLPCCPLGSASTLPSLPCPLCSTGAGRRRRRAPGQLRTVPEHRGFPEGDAAAVPGGERCPLVLLVLLVLLHAKPAGACDRLCSAVTHGSACLEATQYC